MPDPQVANYDIVALQNIDDEDFVFEYDRSRGNYPYLIRAGEVKRFPRFLAEHALKHLIDKILNKRKEKTNNEMIRKSLASQIVIGEETFQQQPVKSEVDRLKEEVDRMNQPSELESILKKQRSAEKKGVPDETPPTTVLAEEEKFAGLGPTVDTTETLPTPASPVPEVKAVPTRSEIYAYAQNKMGMTMDEKTKKEWDKMKVDELLREVGDPREALA